MSTHFDPEAQLAPKGGLLLLQGLILFLFCIFALRFWYLQVHRGAEFARLAQENQTRRQLIYAPRGLFRDRTGELLAVNQPAYALAVVREDVRDIDATLTQISHWTGLEIDELRAKFDKARRRVKPFKPLILVSDLSFELLARIEANALFWPGLEIVIRPRRFYPQGALLSHILGYVAEANEKELEKDEDLDLGDYVGKQGLEYILERKLRGRKGVEQAKVDATGRLLEHKMERYPSAGTNVDLSIDLKLQEVVAEQMEGMAGAVVVMEPHTGRILAQLSNPGFPNNAFTRGLSSKQWTALSNHPRHPMQNRVIQSVFPPGSVWKLLVAACALKEGAITTKDKVFCNGRYPLGKRVFRCWKKHGHGWMDMKQALVQSCDVYFYQLGERLGVDKISKFAFECGFGKKTGIDLPHEKTGLVPTREWKRKRFNEPWQGGENLNLAIGQGFTLVSPLQAARFISSLLNGGSILKPNLLQDAPVDVQGTLGISDAHRKLILEAMVETVNSNRGTARRLRRPDARIGGKTGTAQVVRIMSEERRKTDEMPYLQRDHAWLASFGEKEGHSYVVVCMVEHGGHGGSTAGPVVKAVYEYLFDPKRNIDFQEQAHAN